MKTNANIVRYFCSGTTLSPLEEGVSRTGAANSCEDNVLFWYLTGNDTHSLLVCDFGISSNAFACLPCPVASSMAGKPTPQMFRIFSEIIVYVRFLVGATGPPLRPDNDKQTDGDGDHQRPTEIKNEAVTSTLKHLNQ